MNKHKHRMKKFSDQCYTGHARDQRAAGNITRIEECRCGATRRVNINGRWRDATPWNDATTHEERQRAASDMDEVMR